MKLKDLYDKVPVSQHGLITIDAAGHVFFGGKEYVQTFDGELNLIREDSPKIDAIAAKLGATVISK